MRAFRGMAGVVVVAAALSAACPSAVLGQDAGGSLEERAIRAFAAGDYEAAEAALHLQLEEEPGNFVAMYNLACVRAMRGDTAEAGEMLIRAVEHGFTDIRQLTHDPHLAPLRGDPRYLAIVQRWDEILERRAATDLERARERFGAGYLYERDGRLRLLFASGFTAETTAQCRAEVERIYEWAMAEVFGETHTELAGSKDAWVLVALPTRRDFERWAVETYGPAARGYTQGIGGHYNHDTKQLVTGDLGASLRHEFMHVLHWRSTTRLGQIHPVWVQEGLCSLVEDYDPGPDGRPVPVPSWRTNQARFLAEAGKLLKVRDLVSVPREHFTGTRPLAFYGQARTLFLFLHSRGRLSGWYKHFTEHFRDDPTGLASLEAALEMSAEEIDSEYRRWLLSLPKAPEEVRVGSASLGVQIDATGTGEGLTISAFVPRSAAGGLRVGDVITHVDGRAVRDYYELVRVLAQRSPGETVEVGYRRGRLHGTAEVTLKKAE
ncbi:MAG: hypothetical protein AMXMBFR77_13640 [Phycisphaerales bacterium]|nr:PDZ domain-containing protein [Leptolyngbya sp.]MCZ7634191.1 PDZ domain-containing protein [Phycisphaerales bacterium]MDL1905106.1 PDZ domain-containing protein [Synechococcales cyanobacterium CNB]GIK19347.1 MAG: hypothetical protein BroJett004_15110 [Planctomycetota bacterium]